MSNRAEATLRNVSSSDIRAFGNPSAFHENQLYHLFCEQGKEELYHLIVSFGVEQGPDAMSWLLAEDRKLIQKITAGERKRFEDVRRHILRNRGALRWLDVGCGCGQFIEAILRSNSSLAVGTDISAGGLSWAGRLLRKRIRSNRYALIRQDTQGLPFKDECFDRILSADVLEHVGYNNQKSVLSEMYRVLKGGGKVIAHTPNLNRVRLTTVLKKVYYGFKGYNPFSIRHSFRLDHKSLSTAARLRRICEEIGFTVEVHYELGSGFLARHPWLAVGFHKVLSRSFFLALTKPMAFNH